MASELTIDYTLSYKVSIDVDTAREDMYDLWLEADEDDEQFLEFLRDGVLAALEAWEDDKMFGVPLPRYVTHFSVSEHST